MAKIVPRHYGDSNQSGLDALNAAMTDALSSGITTKEILTMLQTVVAEQETDQPPLQESPEEGQDFVYEEIPPGMIALPVAARKYGRPITTLQSWVQRGHLPTYGRVKAPARGGGYILISESDLLDWIKAPPNKGGRPKKVPGPS